MEHNDPHLPLIVILGNHPLNAESFQPQEGGPYNHGF